MLTTVRLRTVLEPMTKRARKLILNWTARARFRVDIEKPKNPYMFIGMVLTMVVFGSSIDMEALFIVRSVHRTAKTNKGAYVSYVAFREHKDTFNSPSYSLFFIGIRNET